MFSSIAAQLTEVASDVATSIYRYFGAFIIKIPPFAAQASIALATFTAEDTAGYTIPAFTSLTLTDPSGNQQPFETLVDTVIAPSASTATSVTLSAVTPGSDTNGCSGIGLNCPLAFVTGIATTTAASGGTDDEDDTAYLGRLTTELETLSPKPITVNDFDNIVLSQPLVGRVTTLAGFNPANATQVGTTHTSTSVTALGNAASIPVGASISGSGVPSNTFVQSVNVGASTLVLSAPTTTSVSGTTLTIGGSINNPGDVGSVVTDVNGVALTSPQMSAIQAAIQAECLVGVLFSVVAPTITPVSVTASVVSWSGQDTGAVQTLVQGALDSFLTSFQWGFQVAKRHVGPWLNDNVVRISMLTGIIQAVPGVHYVSSVQINSLSAGTDLPLAGIVPLPSAGTMTITVTTG